MYNELVVNNQRGVVLLPLLIIVFILGIIGYFLIQTYQPETSQQSNISEPSPITNTIQAGGTTINSPGGIYKIYLPDGSFQESTIVELLVVPMSCDTPGNPYRNAGYNVRVSNESGNVEALKPFTLTFDYGDATFEIIREDTLKAWYCDTANNTNPTYSDSIATELDMNNKKATLTGTKMGTYGLIGELKCPKDVMEYDGDYYSAKSVGSVKGSIGHGSYPDDPQKGDYLKRYLISDDDEDWFIFSTEDNKNYYLETVNRSEGVNTVITLIENDGVTKVRTVENIGDEDESRLEVPSGSRVYFAKVSPAKASLVGCSASYDFRVVEE